MTIVWNKIHRFQEKPGWCGPAVIQMVLLASGTNKTQEEIAKEVYLDWWGTSQDMLIAYLSKYFTKLGLQENSSVENISKHLDANNIVIANWWDNLDDGDPDGHYTLVGGLKENNITMIDPSNSRSGIWDMDLADFKKRWFHYMDVHNKIKIERFLIWVDIASKL